MALVSRGSPYTPTATHGLSEPRLPDTPSALPKRLLAITARPSTVPTLAELKSPYLHWRSTRARSSPSALAPQKANPPLDEEELFPSLIFLRSCGAFAGVLVPPVLGEYTGGLRKPLPVLPCRKHIHQGEIFRGIGSWLS